MSSVTKEILDVIEDTSNYAFALEAMSKMRHMHDMPEKLPGGVDQYIFPTRQTGKTMSSLLHTINNNGSLDILEKEYYFATINHEKLNTELRYVREVHKLRSHIDTLSLTGKYRKLLKKMIAFNKHAFLHIHINVTMKKVKRLNKAAFKVTRTKGGWL